MKRNIMFSIFMLLILVVGLTGCSQPIMIDGVEITDAEQVVSAVNNAHTAGIKSGMDSVDITADNAEAVKAATDVLEAEKAALVEEKAALLAELQAKIVVEAETEAEAEVAAETELSGYKVDDVSLTGNFSETIDSDDFDKLSYYEVEYNDEKYDVEEVLVLSGNIKPKLNLKDLDGEVVVEIADEGAIEYRVELDSEILISGDDLELNFLGEPLSIVSFDGSDSITYRMSQKLVGEEGSVFTVEGKTVTVVSINDDGDKVVIDVDGERSIVSDNDEDINGLQIQLVDALKSSTFSYIELYVGDKVTETVSNEEEYEADERFEWVIEGDVDSEGNNVLSAIGLKLIEEKTDDDEVMKVGDSIAFPNDFIKVTFDSINNMELKDVNLRVTNDDVRLSFEGKIEVAEEKVDDGKIVFFMDGSIPSYQYEHNGEDSEILTEMKDIILFQGDRELSVAFSNVGIRVFDNDVIYRFGYSFDDEKFTSLDEDANKINDDDDFRMNNGDLLYKLDDLSDNDVDEVSFGLVSDEAVECVLSIE